MSKYMVLYEVDTSRTPEDAKTKKVHWLGMLESAARQLKEGVIKDWGGFPGEMSGYVIFEGSAVDLHTYASMWVPFCRVKTKEILTLDEVIKSTKALPE